MRDAATARQTALTRDVLEKIKLCPEHLPAWWRMVASAVRMPREEQALLVADIGKLYFFSPQAQWLRLSALYCLTNLPQYLEQMASLAPALPDPDRWMALAAASWGYCLSQARDREQFRRLLIETRVAPLLSAAAAGVTLPQRDRMPRSKPARVAIVAPHLAGATHAPTTLTFDLRALLEGQGIGTAVFAAQELSLLTMSGYFAGADRSQVRAAEPTTWQVRTAGNASVTLADEEFSLQARWTQLAGMIDGWDPDLILLVGFSSPLAWALGRRYPVLGMSIHTLPPLSPVDVWLAADAQVNDSIFWPDLPAPQAVHFPFRFWPGNAVGGATRAAIGVPQDAVLLVTSGHRLGSEITD